MTIAALTRVPAVRRPRSIAGWIRAYTPRPVRAAAMAAAIRLCKPATANRTAAVLLFGYALVWALSSTIAKIGQTLQGDMAEAFALSRELSIGYVKHPPLIDWVVAGWFSVMPVTRWSFYLLSYLNAAVALGAVWLTARYVVDAKRRVLAVALLGLVPIFNFHSGTFNHNTFQTSLWALAALGFFASIERREIVYSVLFGIAAALALLGKYYAIWIDFALFGASLLHPNRAIYWRSWRPYVAGATALIVLAPHLIWQIHAGFVTVDEPFERLPENGGLTAVRLSLSYCGAALGYLAPVLVTIWMMSSQKLSSLVPAIFHGWPARRIAVAWIALVPLFLPVPLLPPLVHRAAHIPWMYPALFLVPLAIVSAPGLSVRLRDAAFAVAAFGALTLAALIASPILMVTNFLTANETYIAPMAQLARTATAEWHSATGRRLQYVGGDPTLVWQTSFYSADHPHALPDFKRNWPPDVVAREWNERGVVGLCRADDVECNARFAAALIDPVRKEVTLSATFLGFSRGQFRYVIYLVPGRAEAKMPGRKAGHEFAQ